MLRDGVDYGPIRGGATGILRVLLIELDGEVGADGLCVAIQAVGVYFALERAGEALDVAAPDQCTFRWAGRPLTRRPPRSSTQC